MAVKPTNPQDNAPVNNDPIISDDAFFGPPGGGIDDIDPEDMPIEIKELMETHGLNEKSYQCMLKEVRNSDGEAVDSYITSWRRRFPTIEWIGKNYGPGTYRLCFIWRGVRADGKTGSRTENIPIEISDKYQDIYDEFQLQKKIERVKRKNKMIRDAKLSKQLEDDLNLEGVSSGNNANPDVQGAAKGYYKEMLDFAQSVGLQKKGLDWEKLMPLLITGVPAIMKIFSERAAIEREERNRFMTLLMTMNSNSSQQLVDVIKSQNGPSSGTQYMKEITDMIVGAMDLKTALSPEKETVVDKIFKTIEGVAPAIVQMASMKQAERENNVAYKMARTYVDAAPEFKQMENDPMIKHEVINRLDEVFGWEQADMILAVAGYERPQDCPRDPSMQYPQNHPSRQRQDQPTPEQERPQKHPVYNDDGIEDAQIESEQ